MESGYELGSEQKCDFDGHCYCTFRLSQIAAGYKDRTSIYIDLT